MPVCVLLVCVSFTLADRASTIPVGILRGCQFGTSTWSARQENIRGNITIINKAPTKRRIIENTQKTRQKEREIKKIKYPIEIGRVHRGAGDPQLKHVRGAYTRAIFFRRATQRGALPREGLV